MKNIATRILFIPALIIIISICGCILENGNNTIINISTSNISASPYINNTRQDYDGFLFLNHYKYISGEDIDGRYPNFKHIDFPGYYFPNKNMTTLTITTPINISRDRMDDLIAIVGSGESLSGVMGEGVYSRAIGVYAIPAVTEGLNILTIDRDGTTYIQYQEKIITLKPGDKWETQTSRIEEKHNETVNYKTNITTTDTIENIGFWRINKDYICERVNG